MNRSPFLPVLWLFALFIAAWPLGAQTRYQAALNRFVRSESLRQASVSVSVVDVADGRTVAAHDAARSVTPASSLKLLTTATALAVMGHNYRFSTRLEYDGRIDENGVLLGNLYLAGSGDPSLGSPDMPGAVRLNDLLERLAQAVQQAGIRRIAGRVVGDDDIFGTDATGIGWPWGDLGNYYGAGAWGLNLHNNYYYLHLKQRRELGQQPRIEAVRPDVPGLKWVNELRSSGPDTGDNAYIYGAPYSFERYLRGHIPVGTGSFVIRGAVPDAPLFAAQQLAAALAKKGITAAEAPATVRKLPNGGKGRGARSWLYTHFSPPLADIVRYTNLVSNNMYAEALLRCIAVYRGYPGTAYNGSAAIRGFWRSRGLRWDGVHVADGSGLSPGNALPAHFLAHLLRAAYNDASIRDAFYRSLPIAGRSGTLRNTFAKTSAAGRLRAKTGSLERVRSYSGYFPSSDGKLYAFCILVENYTGSGWINDLARLVDTWCE